MGDRFELRSVVQTCTGNRDPCAKINKSIQRELAPLAASDFCKRSRKDHRDQCYVVDENGIIMALHMISRSRHLKEPGARSRVDRLLQEMTALSPERTSIDVEKMIRTLKPNYEKSNRNASSRECAGSGTTASRMEVTSAGNKRSRESESVQRVKRETMLGYGEPTTDRDVRDVSFTQEDPHESDGGGGGDDEIDDENGGDCTPNRIVPTNSNADCSKKRRKASTRRAPSWTPGERKKQQRAIASKKQLKDEIVLVNGEAASSSLGDGPSVGLATGNSRNQNAGMHRVVTQSAGVSPPAVVAVQERAVAPGMRDSQVGCMCFPARLDAGVQRCYGVAGFRSAPLLLVVQTWAQCGEGAVLF